MECIETENKISCLNEGEEIGFIKWNQNDDKTITVTTTYVNPNYRGLGIAGTLVEKIFEFALDNGVKIIPLCSYVKKVFESSEKYNKVYVKE